MKKKYFVFIYCTEQLNLKNISYWHYFRTKIMLICPIWNFTPYITQGLHFFENHPDRKYALTRGTKNLHIDGLKLHDKHQEHLLCVKHRFKELDDPQAAAGPSQAFADASIGQSLLKLCESQRKRLESLFTDYSVV